VRTQGASRGRRICEVGTGLNPLRQLIVEGCQLAFMPLLFRVEFLL
jgi:hypothetical protein